MSWTLGDLALGDLDMIGRIGIFLFSFYIGLPLLSKDPKSAFFFLVGHLISNINSIKSRSGIISRDLDFDVKLWFRQLLDLVDCLAFGFFVAHPTKSRSGQCSIKKTRYKIENIS